jgi:putative Mg2+ transporter-C (MgtC) family protein
MLSFVDPAIARFLELAARIIVGTLLGSVIGYERDLHGRPAGLRTHALVGLGASTLMVVSTQFVYFQHYAKDDLVGVDSSRIAASVVSGIGFLAGGAILRSGLTVQGLTTAAALWVVAAIGLAAGGGMFGIAVLTTLTGVAALTLLRRFEDKHLVRWTLSIVLEGSGAQTSTIISALRAAGALVSESEFERRVANGATSIVLDVRSPDSLATHEIAAIIERTAGVSVVSLKQPQ